jgi:repressor LexA
MDDTDLTAEEGRVLQVISTYIAENGFSPSMREIQQAAGFPSTSSTYRVLDSLRTKGKLEWRTRVNRTIRLAAKS